MTDQLLYGQSFVSIDDSGIAKHIAYEDIYSVD